jgi:hypothetical protein
MPDSNERDQKLARAMLKSKVEYPSSDLESTVMSRVKIVKGARVALKNKRLSVLFLAIEIALGLFINFTLERFPMDVIPGMSPLTLLNLFQIGCGLIFFIQLEHCLSETVEKTG